MFHKGLRDRRTWLGFVFILICGLAAASTLMTAEGPAMAQGSPETTVPDSRTVYLPMIENRLWPAAQIGADFGHMTSYPDVYADVIEVDFPLVQQMGGDWVRVWLPWAFIETAPGVFDWSEYDRIFERLDALGMEPLVLIFFIPEWAADNGCGPITDEAALVRFTTALVERYQNVAGAWEFLNEPEAFDPHPYGPVIGCWGRYPQAYAEYLEVFYRTVKGIDPNALVFFGGLAYDGWDVFNRDFFPDTLAYGAGDFFDGLSFHFYPINPDDFPSIRDKIEELRNIMADHGVTGKRLWVTETSMWTNSETGLEGQRDFVVKEFTRGYCTGADNMLWFAIRQDLDYPPVLFRWLIDAEHNLVNAHDTFSHYAGRVKGGYCFGPMADLPENVEAYQFDTDAGPVIIAWTDEGAATLSVAADTSRILLDREGVQLDVLSPGGGQILMPVNAVPRFLVTQ